MVDGPIRLEVERFDSQPPQFRTRTVDGVASEDTALQLNGGDEGTPYTTSTTYSGSSGTFDVVLGTFDESDGDSQIIVRVGGVEIANFLLDQSPGSGKARADTYVELPIASGISVADGDLIEITVIRDGRERVHLDYLELVPAIPPSPPVGPVSDDDPTANEIAENAVPGTEVGIIALAIDPDAGDTVSYSVDDPRFTVDAAGLVTVAPGASFDAETEPTVTITVTATSSDTSTSSESFDITITDVEEPVGPLTDVNGATNEVPDDAGAGTEVGITALAIDPDVGDTVSYSVDDPRFAVDAGGVVTIAPGAVFDANAEPFVTIAVTATSSDTSTSTESFTVAVTTDPPPTEDPIRLEVEQFDTQPSEFRTRTVNGVASEDVALQLNGGDEDTPYTTSTTYAGPSGTYDLVLGTFDESDGDSRIIVRIDGIEIANFLLDQNPGSGKARADSYVELPIAGGVSVTDGDLIEITVFRDGRERVHLDYLELVPTPPTGPPAAFKLSALDGVSGFRIDGIDLRDFSGSFVSGLGDVNGDGLDDLIIGAEEADPNGNNAAGESYVVFGSSNGFDASLDLSSLDGSNGFRLDGIDELDRSGESVSALGDVNGDDLDDFIIGAAGGDPNGNSYAGESYVVFGSTNGFGASLDLSSLDGSNGFRIDGIDEIDRSGHSVSGLGDVNGDGLDDLIIGARYADPDGVQQAGESYVVFGSRDAFGASLDLSSLDGSNGFRIDGVQGRSGESVSGLGDINGDGLDDLIIGAREADPNGNANSGSSYVVFGSRDAFGASLDLSSLDGSNGFRLDGIDEGDRAGESVSGLGDVNGDGLDDLIIGAIAADPNGRSDAGESYVVFGSRDAFPASLDLSSLDGSNGFRLDGIDEDDRSGFSVSGLGDVNADGLSDLIIGAFDADPDGNIRAGESYVVFGSRGGFGPSLDLSSLDGTNGFRLDGVAAGDESGISVSGLGDVNGDGVDDLIIGAEDADPDGIGEAGASYVVFGGPGGPGSTVAGYNFAPVVDDDSFSVASNAGAGTVVGTVSASDPNFGDTLSFFIAFGNDDDLFAINGNGEITLTGPLNGALADGRTLVVEATDSKGYVSRGEITLSETPGTQAAFFQASAIDGTTGTPGDDLLFGSLGNDTLTGLTGEDRFVISEGDDRVADFAVGEDSIGLEGLLSGVVPTEIADYVELTRSGPDAQFTFDRDGVADFSPSGREGTLTLSGVDLTGKSLDDLLDDGTLWLA